MNISQTPASTHDRPLRLWPGVAAAVLLVLVSYVLPIVVPAAGGATVFGGMIGGLLIIVWWLFFSRAPWIERLGGLVLIIAAVLAVRLVVHPSIAGGMMGLMPVIFGVPILALGLVVWAVASRRFSQGIRRAAMVAAIAIACVPLTLIRTDGISGDGGVELEWRWTPTAEQRLLAQAPNVPLELAPAPAEAEAPAEAPAEAEAPSETGAPAVARAEWPGFRGPSRDGVVRGVQVATDWSTSPPIELWRRPIGPGWSSFAVHGDLIYTQEQRGEHELVSAYRLSTGEPVWRHADAVRFYESNGGAGPRGTPTLGDGRVYAHGATGIVNALDAATGAVVWSRNSSADTGSEMPGWGFASSPLAAGGAVVVASSGRLVAYDAATGEPRWVRTTGGGGYSSPHLATIDGIAQIILLSGGGGATSVAPADGTVLWQHAGKDGAAIVQPAVLADGDVVIAGGDMMGGTGLQRVAARKTSGGWAVDERWTSRGLKPYFNDFVVHNGYAFGFDGTILSCISLEDGERKWKGGRYGAGQMMLLADKDLLLVTSEDGELVLVSATPDRFMEIARVPALDGKTWNHPVLVGDVLLVRNGEEMAAFRLPLAGR